MKKLCCMIALAAISFGSVYAHASVTPLQNDVAQQDTVKKKMKKKGGKMKTKTKRDTTKRDTMKM
jgi:hypothetical protein